MWSLFSTNSSEAGFRLQYMEVYNWGTFDKNIFRIAPKSNNSLLTGANGSGKTTFIDALLTLLVPLKTDRFYNQSSGVEKKGDRNEESYVLGHYGDIQNVGELGSTTQRLRDKNCYSVLLAYFSNKDQRPVTLFQVRSFSNGELKRTFGIAHKALNIQNDFSNFDTKGNWKKELEKIYNASSSKKIVEFFDGPTKYADRMVHLFGMRSRKALSLFNQVVGIKVLGDLDEFIRTNMLENQDAESKYQELKEVFTNLMDAKNNIDKAKEQILQLETIDEIANKLSRTSETLKELQTEKETAVFWFAKKGVELFQEELKRIKNNVEESNETITKLKNLRERLDEEKGELSTQIKNDEVGQQIQDLSTVINNITKERNKRKEKLDKYNTLAQKIDFPINPNSDSFFTSKELAKEKKNNCTTDNERETEKLRQAKNRRDEIEKNIQDRIDIVKILQSNKNNISGRVAGIREDILEEIGATKNELPFVGELIKIKDNEKNWETAIEKVLHNFALRLIVPEKYYHHVNEYVNRTNLRGRIIYQRYKDFNSLKEMQLDDPNKNALIYKIEFKPKSPYTEWIEDTIKNRFNYNCAENLNEFNMYEKAITKEGLIKFGKEGKHEKDDRKHTLSKENYVLGWDNKKKIVELEKSIRKEQEVKVIEDKNIQELQNSIKLIKNQEENFSDFFKLFTRFDEIDWQTSAKEIQEKTERKEKLEKSNDKIKELQRQLETVQEELDKNEKQTHEQIRLEENLKIQKENIFKQLTTEKDLLSQFSETIIDLTNFEKENTNLLNINFSNFLEKQKAFQENNKKKISEQEQEKNKLEKKATVKISAFKNPSEEIATKYKSWRSDVHHLPENIDYIEEYQKKYLDLKKEGLPQFEAKFNDYFEKDTITKVVGFNFFFKKWSDDIEANIRSLNEALYEIDFKNSPKTYIQLVPQKKRLKDVQDFENQIKNAIPNLKETENSANMQRIHFEDNIEPFIKNLEDEYWRTKVMDVRSWFEYKAEEFYRESGEKHKTYSGMGQLSGGEKAQLTFTILGSAIAYQFGLTKEGLQTNSFRFIAIDEAFKAQDEEKARYLITLCKQLHLQLLVVTPSDNIHIVEDDISFVHFVERKDEKTSWLYDMPIEQFKTERDSFSK